MVVADLHVHTTVSDGTLTLDELPAAAQAAGVEAVAVTDHDRFHPGLSEPVETREGIELVRGIELRADAGFDRVDLLGFGLRETAALAAECERLQQDRLERARRIVERVEAETGVELAIEIEPGVGRPHIARAIEESAAPYDRTTAFAELIGRDCPCYVAREIPGVDRAVELLQEACAVVGLAHPFRYDDPEQALGLVTSQELDGVERFYQYSRAEQPDPGPVDRLLEANDLLALGGSDAHDRTLGVTGLGESDWQAVRERLPTA